MEYTLLDVFTKTRFEGNPLAVFPNAAGLSDIEMQKIAAELNLSESVFLLEPTLRGAIGKARIFTPRRELDFAGHPTIGAASVLYERKTSGSQFAIEENVGLVQIDVEKDESGDPVFWLTTPEVKFFEAVDPSFAAQLLNLSGEDIVASVPPQFASAGSPLLFICVQSTEVVDRAELQQVHLKYALGSANSVGTFVFSQKPDSLDVYSRMFAPQTGIPEDPATGGATGPLAAYMLKYRMLPRSNVQFTSEQGTKMGRRSMLHVKIDATNAEPSIKVGGAVVKAGEGNFFI